MGETCGKALSNAFTVKASLPVTILVYSIGAMCCKQIFAGKLWQFGFNSQSFVRQNSSSVRYSCQSIHCTSGTCLKAFPKYFVRCTATFWQARIDGKKYVLAQWRRFEDQAFDNFINISISPCSHWENYRDQLLWVIINSPTLLGLSLIVLFCKRVSVIIAILVHACIWVFWIDAMVSLPEILLWSVNWYTHYSYMGQGGKA